MSDQRPNPDELLARVQAEEVQQARGEIDVYVISGDPDEVRPARLPALRRTSDWSAYGWSLASVAGSTALAWLMFPYFELTNLIVIYRAAKAGGLRLVPTASDSRHT